MSCWRKADYKNIRVGVTKTADGLLPIDFVLKRFALFLSDLRAVQAQAGAGFASMSVVSNFF